MALALILSIPPTVRAEPPADDEAARLAATYATPWPALQQADGQFHDYVSGAADGAGRYGEAMLGYALLRTGLRASDPLQVDAGLRAIAMVLRHPERQQSNPSVFETYALAAAYNVVRERLADDPRVAALMPAWQARLASERPLHLRRGRPYWNKTIVEAVAVLELLRTGLRSRTGGTWLRDRAAARARVTGLINRSIPRRAPHADGRVMLSDPPACPLAYHALSLGFYARAVALLGRGARPRAKRVLLEAARTSYAVAAPDGDLAYAGRSQEQAWALAFTAYGAESAARLARGGEVARLRGLANRALTRLRALHPVIDGGLAIVPAFRSGPRAWYRGIDGYAGAGPYNGLTIAALELAADVNVDGGTPIRIPPTRDAASSISAQTGDMAILRRGAVWMAVKRARSGRDLRYDSGLIALKWRSAGVWRDVIPLRPKAVAPSLGPTLLVAGRAHEAWGGRVEASRGRIRVLGGFRRGGGRVVFAYVPTDRGVVLRFRGRPGATYRYSTFFAAADAPRVVDDRSVAGVGQTVRVSAPMLTTFTAGFSSAVEPDLVRVDATFVAGASGRVAIEIAAS